MARARSRSHVTRWPSQLYFTHNPELVRELVSLVKGGVADGCVPMELKLAALRTLDAVVSWCDAGVGTFTALAQRTGMLQALGISRRQHHGALPTLLRTAVSVMQRQCSRLGNGLARSSSADAKGASKTAAKGRGRAKKTPPAKVPSRHASPQLAAGSSSSADELDALGLSLGLAFVGATSPGKGVAGESAASSVSKTPPPQRKGSSPRRLKRSRAVARGGASHGNASPSCRASSSSRSRSSSHSGKKRKGGSARKRGWRDMARQQGGGKVGGSAPGRLKKKMTLEKRRGRGNSQEATALSEEQLIEWVEAVLNLTMTVVYTKEGAAALTEAGLMSCLLKVLCLEHPLQVLGRRALPPRCRAAGARTCTFVGSPTVIAHPVCDCRALQGTPPPL